MKITSTFSLANGFVIDRVWCSECHALLRSAKDTRFLKTLSGVGQVGVLAAVWALLFTNVGSSAFQAIGPWVILLLLVASLVIHFLLSVIVVLVFGRSIKLELRDTRRAA
jgi:hypothetical protein